MEQTESKGEQTAGRPSMEEYALVLDFLSEGKSADVRREPVAQAIGESHFTLLEVVPKPGTPISVGERIYIGKGEREKVDHIKGRISFFELTGGAKSELEHAVKLIIDSREADFVAFFNKSGPVTTRLHQLELLPGIGRKHLWAIITERKKSPFASFEDIKKRVPLLPHPEKLIVRRILGEMEDKDKYRIFVPRWEKKAG